MVSSSKNHGHRYLLLWVLNLNTHPEVTLETPASFLLLLPKLLVTYCDPVGMDNEICIQCKKAFFGKTRDLRSDFKYLVLNLNVFSSQIPYSDLQVCHEKNIIIV